VQKLFLEGKCRNEKTKELKKFSLQLQVTENEYNICGLCSLNLSPFASVISMVPSYNINFVQIKNEK